ncbi:ATP-binding cassette subfamily B protein/subfamily B ATP-binding cassette protein MsbA [Cytobacillus firmus]|uniref:ATP-binding cassette subfamily B protein/subfamily B ATP-binding cassette protein MsbA n=2 Tax=Cytobacillus TaxID=2675230 RepID=A0A366JL02_CYTFI|nr:MULTISPECIES: ABC transporter ATP-binding protein [Cytobacillus]RBP88260.1 ATP-binding cassette subfamily B protein/subfamily B ATP-binding cassette protein MsbA [Cytobacillus firmus]TDX38333.1 ATP-binding cassette subfamily B protein/subfamily B ATP-binding cassette protein MsbA [Cytobacillus oceanisediminis]
MNTTKRQRLIRLMKEYFTMKDILKTLALLKPFIVKHRIAYFVLFGLLAVDIFLTIAFAAFFGKIADAAVQADFNQIKELVLIGICLVLVSIVTSFMDIYFETVATNGVKKDLKNHLFSHILRLPSSKVSNMRSGEVISHFTNDIHSLDGVIGYSLINLVRLPLIFIAVFIFLIQINVTLSLLSLLITPFALVAGLVFGLLLRRNSRLIHSLFGKINTHINETFNGIGVIRSFTLEKSSFEKFKSKNEELFKLEKENAKLQGWFYSGGSLISSVTFYVSLLLGAYYVSKNIMTVGALLTFVNLVNHLVYPLTGLAGQWAGFQRSVTAVERLLDVLEEPADSEELPSYSVSKPLMRLIEFHDITFSYDESHKVFEGLNLTIPAGKVIAIVGPSGAGKSTLFNLLQSFYQPQSGGIYIDQVSMGDITLSNLRSIISHVPQETFLFAGTFRENLMIAKPGISETQMVSAAKDAYIHDFIMSLPEGYDTEIGERGVKLSGGQKQRLAIARAILKNASILLLDEATSALDSETEFHVKEALGDLMKGRTTLIIAHRLSTVENADVIIVMDQGKIVQMGSHQELITQPGLYRMLHKTKFQSKKASAFSLA